MVLYVQASHLQVKAGTLKGSMLINSTVLQRQGWLKPQLPMRRLTPKKGNKAPAAISKPAANIVAARAEFYRAGISEEVTTKVLKLYNPYLRWDTETKLRPSLELWVKQLGSQQLSARLQKAPRLLCRTPEECSEVYVWLASIGVDAERIQQKVPQVMARPLHLVQSTVRAVQQLLDLTDDKLPAFLKRHAYCLLHTPEHVGQTLRTVAELLAVLMTSEEMQKVTMVCDQQLFHQDPAMVRQRVSFFCEEYGGGQAVAKKALKQRIHSISAETMRSHAAELKAMLGWTEGVLNQRVTLSPIILARKPSTVANNILKLQAHGFLPAQALDVVASYPVLAAYDWNSQANTEKLTYLQHILQLSPAEIVSRPQLLLASLHRKIGPRTEFLYAYQGISHDTPFGLVGHVSCVEAMSDAKFASGYRNPSASPPLIYDEEFKRHWQQRWKFLVCDMGLSYDDISACRLLLQTSLLSTLAPRWHFLALLETAKTDFKAADHLTALATLSDEHFAGAFSLATAGLVYDQNFMHRVRRKLC